MEFISILVFQKQSKLLYAWKANSENGDQLRRTGSSFYLQQKIDEWNQSQPCNLAIQETGQSIGALIHEAVNHYTLLRRQQKISTNLYVCLKERLTCT
jgi:hypothetical protein